MSRVWMGLVAMVFAAAVCVAVNSDPGHNVARSVDGEWATKVKVTASSPAGPDSGAAQKWFKAKNFAPGDRGHSTSGAGAAIFLLAKQHRNAR